ncbi:MAG TPA: hypothetical protein VEC60_02875 [Reyranella sp.]|nr:hypothetical protein [Reyranella sp.]
MSLHWDILHDEQLVKLRTEGVLRFSDVTAYLEAVRDGGAIGYRKLCDAREGHSELTEAELLSYLGAVSGYSKLAPLGPQALVLTEASARAHQPMLRMLFVNEDRDLRIFTSPEDALEWLMRQPLSG